jgi:alkylation response protein AidB-like acyl-CoA dehydrogenase
VSVLSVPKPSWFGEDVELLSETARRFFERECVPHYEEWERRGSVGTEIWRKAGAAGLLGPSVPEAFGGPGGNFAHDAAITSEVNRTGVSGFGIALHNSIVLPYILHYGSDDQKRNWLPRLVSGEYIGAIAMTEPSGGSDLQAVKTTARRSGNHYVISGSKTFITNGQLANFIIVVAKTDPTEGAKGISLFAIETQGLEGFKRGRNLDKVGLKANDTSELFFDDARVPASALIGPEEGQGFAMLMNQLPQERLTIAIYAMARIERALEVTLDYVKQRHAFGKCIAEFQNTQFELAECKTEATIARVFVDHCIGRHLDGGLDTATASMAKYWLTDLQCKIIDRCLQLHGGYGYMNEFPIARMFRDARVERIYGGTNEIMKVLIARTL